MAKSFSQENARLRREIALLRKAGEQRATALYNAVHAQGETVASAATITLKDPVCDISGTATISAIASADIGQIRRVRFLGAATLTHNATSLILPGGSNITCAANDTAEFQSLGSGNWVCSRYMLASGAVIGVVPITKGGTGSTTAITAYDSLHTQSTDIASASTVDLSAATGEYVVITGTTTITAFSSQTAGVVRRITFSGVLTLTHNATSLRLPNSRNITTAANDHAEFVSLGSGNWACTRYLATSGQSVAVPMIHNTRLSAPGGPVTNVDLTNVTSIVAYQFQGIHMTVGSGPPVSFGSSVRTFLQQSQSGTTTNASGLVTGLTSTAQLICGMTVSGTGIPGGTTIYQINGATSLTLSANATASGITSLTFKLPANSNFDVFAAVVNNAIVLRFGRAWTDAVTRALDLQIATGTGIYTNQTALGETDLVEGGTANKVLAGAASYLGTIRTTATAGETEDSVSKRFIWSMYNRFPRKLKVTDTTDSWAYTTATWRQARASTANQVEWIVGLNEDLVNLRVHGLAINATNNVNAATGIGIDSTTVNSADLYGGSALTVGMSVIPAQYSGYPGIGYHYAAWLEISAATGTTNWRGDNGLTYQQSGMMGSVMG